MPSGAKKRKASKKKMENNYATHSTVAVNNQSMNGDDGIKQLNEEGEKIEHREIVQSNVSDKNSEKEAVHDGGNDKISSSEKDESSDSSSSEGSSGSSSDSDDESHVIEKVEDSVEEIDYKPQEDDELVKEIDYKSQEEADSVKETENFTSSEQASVNVSDGILQTDLHHDEGDVEIENSNGKILAVDSEKDVHDTSSDDESRVIEKVETSSPLKLNEETDYVPHEVKDSVKENYEIVDPDKTVVLDYAIESDDASSDDEVVVDSNDPVQKETEETDTVLENLGTSIESDINVQEKTAVEAAPVGVVAEIDESAPRVEPTRSEEFNTLVEETMSVLASINVPLLSKTVNLNGNDSVESVSNETVEYSLSKNIAESQTDEMNDTVAITITENESDNHEPPESQPLLNSAQRTVQTTSWKSCCGIFDLFDGGNRY